jgi:hypothetical protein
VLKMVVTVDGYRSPDDDVVPDALVLHTLCKSSAAAKLTTTAGQGTQPAARACVN